MKESFEKYLEANHDRFVGELIELASQPSIAAQGIGLPETAALVKHRMERLGARVRLLAVEGAPPVVYAELGNKGPCLTIYNHYDVQPPEPLELWESPPFKPTIRDGRIFARGVADNKGNLLARIQAVEAWLATSGGDRAQSETAEAARKGTQAPAGREASNLPIRLRWIIEGEEETSSAHLEAFVDSHEELVRGADGCLWESGYKDEAGRPVLTMGLKGIAYLELRSRGAKGDLHSAWAPIIPNPAWRLVWALSSLKNDRDEITIDGYLDHVVAPPEEALKAADAIPFEEERIKSDFGIDRFVAGVSGREALRRYLFAPTCTICGFDSGYSGDGAKTVLPSSGRAKVDLRLVPNLTPDLALRLVREHLARRGFDDIEVEMLGGEPPARSSVNSKVARAARAAAEAVAGVPPVVYPNMTGSGPMYHLCDRFGIPAVGAGCGDSASNVHAPNESIDIRDYFDHIKFMGELIERFKEV